MNNLKIFILLVLLFTVLGFIYSYPLIINFNSALPYTHNPAEKLQEGVLIQGDHLQLFYTLWLFKDYLVSGNQKFFEEPYQFSVKGHPRPFTTRELPLSIIFYTCSSLGNISAYNCLVILSFVLCGICMFRLAKKYLHSFSASLTAGFIFTLFPFRLAHLFGGHLSGFLIFWIPIIIYLYELLWEKKKILYGWLAGICIFLMAIEEPHLGYYSALFTIVFWVYKSLHLIYSQKRTDWQKIIILSLPIMLFWLSAAVYMLFIKHTVYSSSMVGAGRSIAEIKLFAPSIKDIFKRINPDSEKYIYTGAVAAALLCLVVFFKIKSILRFNYKENSFPCVFYFMVLIFSLILSIGPNLKYFPLYKICYKIVPFFNFPRSPARIIVFASLSISLLAGYGAKLLLQNKRRLYKFFFTLIIIALICIDFKSFPRTGLSKTVSGNTVYQFVKNTHPEGPILEIPIWPGDTSWSSIYEFYTTIYRIPTINGYSAFSRKKYIDEIFWPLISINIGILTDEQYNLLKNLGIKYILLHEEAYPQKVSPFPFKTALQNLKKNPYVKFIMDDRAIYLFEILDEPSGTWMQPYTTPAKTGLLYECEHMSRRIGKPVEDKDASMDKALLAEEPVSEPTHMVFGPWRLFPPARYRVIYRLKGVPDGEKDSPIATIEITTNQGTERLIYKDISPDKINSAYTDYELNLALEKSIRLEFRIIYYGSGRLWADYIYILCGEETDPVWHYEAEELYHIGKERYDEQASENSAIYVKPGWDPPTDIIFGPYRRYPQGEYNIGFRIKIAEETTNPACTLKVTRAYSDLILAEKTLKGKDFKSVNEYEYHYLTIQLDKPSVLEFKVEFKGEVPVCVDKVTIKSVSNEQQ